jgi:ribonuclease HI
MKNVVIYTDGACSGNPGAGGWGAVLIHEDDEEELSGGETSTTNNRMELMGAIKALEHLKDPCSVEIYTDSKYVKNGITIWIHAWLKNNWKKELGRGKKVKNRDLWEQLLEVSKPHTISWKWVEGHSGSEFNERADALAKSGCKNQC